MSESQNAITVEILGHLGDGMARRDSKPVIIPQGLPGERYSQTEDGFTRLNASGERVEAACSHFGTCGGCALQHVAQNTYLTFKRSLVSNAFKRAGIASSIIKDIKPCLPCPPASRRRVTFTARIVDGTARLGFMGRGSHEFVPIRQCPVAHPMITEALETFNALAGQMLRGSGDSIQLLVTACENGLDLALEAERDPSSDMLAALVRSLARSGILRAAVNGDVIFEREKPIIRFGKASVTPPPGGFLQAVSAAEDAMAELVTNHLAKAKTVADLFCGSGAFTHRLSGTSRVAGFETAQDAVAALLTARVPEGAKPVAGHVRDLFETPLTARELRAFDGVCLDPPRAGASLQCEELARSDVKRIAYVSCNPATLAGDLAVLIKGGYAVKTVQPIDQFLFAPHVEIVVLLEKENVKKRKAIFGRRV
ncbi:MAG: RNA methyltransferase [Pseudomonadota bacterium]